MLPENCLRASDDCSPLSQIQSTCGKSFVCCGENDGRYRILKRDKYTVCFKNSVIDEISHWDEIDIADMTSVLAQALSVINHQRDNEETPSEEGK